MSDSEKERYLSWARQLSVSCVSEHQLAIAVAPNGCYFVCTTFSWEDVCQKAIGEVQIEKNYVFF